MANPVIWFQVTGKDSKKLRGFYGRFFDWTIQHDATTDFGYVGAVDTGIAGTVGPSENGGAGQVTFYVGVDDPAAYLAKAEKLGGRTVVPPMQVAGGHVTIAFFADPEGNMIGLSKGFMPGFER
jgi:predicted enzyme related to lactoylglutathione lyase